MSSYYRQQLEAWLKTIHVKAGRVLDVGGAQLHVSNRVKSWDVKEYYIMDLDDPHENGIVPAGVIRVVCDIQDTAKVTTVVPGHDFIFCLEVAEYWHDPLNALKNLYYLLDMDGILYISFPFIYPHHNPVGKDYLRYTRWGIEKLLAEAGFKIEVIIPRIEQHEHSAMDILNGLYNWFLSQKMRPSKEYSGHNEVGYMVKAIKSKTSKP